MEIDPHIHTLYSRDCRSDPEKVIARAVQMGLGAIAVTDHDNWEGARIARGLDPKGLMIIPGAELKTDRGDVLALFVEDGFKTRVFSEVVDEIRARAGVCIIPHPGDSPKMRHEDLRHADALEVFNSTTTANSNRFAQELAMKLNKPGFGSSDAHMVMEVGNGATKVPDCSSLDELRQRILNGPVVSRSIRSNPLAHRINDAMMFGLKGIWQR